MPACDLSNEAEASSRSAVIIDLHGVRRLPAAVIAKLPLVGYGTRNQATILKPAEINMAGIYMRRTHRGLRRK